MGKIYQGMEELARENMERFWEMPLDELAVWGAEIILKVGLQAEVESFLGRQKYERMAGSRSGYLNGMGRARMIKTKAGDLRVAAHRVKDSDEAYQSKILPRFVRKSEAVMNVIPNLYLEGLSTRDFQRALAPLWRKSGLSRSSISRCNQELKKEFRAWRERDLGEEEILFLFMDGFYLGVKGGTKEKDCLMVAHGVRKDGSRVVLGISLGHRESTESWKIVFDDLENRGLRKPLLLISDGNGGLIRAAKDCWGDMPRQRCIVHRMRNILAQVPKAHRGTVKRGLRNIFYAASEAEAQAAAGRFVRQYGDSFPNACAILGRDLADCLTFYRFPQIYWKRIRTSNVLERSFKEVRRRTNVIGRFPNEMSALLVVWGVLEKERIKWQRIRIREQEFQRIEAAHAELKIRPIIVKGFEALIEAA